jgi:hypothetical protein
MKKFDQKQINTLINSYLSNFYRLLDLQETIPIWIGQLQLTVSVDIGYGIIGHSFLF